METGVSLRSVQPSNTTLVRFDLAPERQAVRTELPAVQTVAAAPEAVELPNDLARRDLRAEIASVVEDRVRAITDRELRQRIAIDEKAGEVVVRRVDPDTGTVVAQFPDDAILRQKAYTRAMVEKIMLEQSGSRAPSTPDLTV